MYKQIRFSLAIFYILIFSVCFAAESPINPKFHAYESNGAPLNGGLIYTYDPVTSIKKTSYPDYDLATPNSNPIVLDTRGEASVFLDGTTKIVLAPATDTNPQTSPIWNMDNVPTRTNPILGYYVSDYDDLANAISDIGATETVLTINKNCVLSDGDSVTIPATLTLNVLNGFTIDGTAGGSTETLTINGKIQAGLNQIFGANLAVTIGVPVTLYVDWFGRDAAAWQSAVDSIPRTTYARYSTIKGVGRYVIDTTILIQKKPLSIVGESPYGLVLVKAPTLTDAAVMVIEENRVKGAASYVEWDPTVGETYNGTYLENITFEGDGRATTGHGLQFRGRNSEVHLKNINIYNFKGAGLMACDPNGSDVYDASNQGISESYFIRILVQNCGDDTNGYAAVEIGRNASGAGDHDNVEVDSLHILYPRHVGLRIKNNNFSGGVIHDWKFFDLRIHGTASLAGNDSNGEAWNSGENLVEIGSTSAESIRPMVFINSKLIQQEDKTSGMYIGNNCAIYSMGCYASGDSAKGKYGYEFYKAKNSLITDIRAESYSSDNLKDMIVIDTSLQSTDDKVTIGSVSAEVQGTAMISFINGADMGMIDDLNQRSYTFQKTKADSLATDTVAICTIGRLGRTEYFKRAYYIPQDDLTANDADYATIKYFIRNQTGASVENVSTTTETSGAGGTGDWTAYIPVPLTKPSTFVTTAKEGYTISFKIEKSGNGVVIPAGTFVIETSLGIRYL